MSSELQQLMAEFEPDADALLRAICSAVVDEDLVEIAKADYEMDFDEHLSALRDVVRTRSVPYPFAEFGHEVCLLWRHTQLEEQGFEPLPLSCTTEIAAHRQRAFACAYILRFEYSNREHLGAPDTGYTAVLLVASALNLGEPVLSAARQSLAAMAAADWCFEDDRFEIALTIVLTTLSTEPTSLVAKHGIRLTTAILKEADQFGLTFASLDHPDLWRSLATHFLVEPQRPHPPEADAALRRLGRMILDGVKS